MDKLNTLISLNEAKNTIDEMIMKIKHNAVAEEETDYRKLLILALTIIGALVVIGAVAYAVYYHFSGVEIEDYDDLFDDEFDEDFEEFDDEDLIDIDEEEDTEE